MCVREGRRERGRVLQCAVRPQGLQEEESRSATTPTRSSTAQPQIGSFCVVHFKGKYGLLASFGEILYETTIRIRSLTRSHPPVTA